MTTFDSSQGRVRWHRIGAGPPVVLLHGTPFSSYVGAVALRAHLLKGVAYERLALTDVVALPPWGSPLFRLVGEHAAVFEALPPHLHEALVRAYVTSASHRELPPEVLTDLVRPWLGDDGQPAFYRQIAQARQADTDEFEPLLGRIDVPVLVCWGVEDEWIPASIGAELARRIPGATFHPIEAAGHLVRFDAPAQLTAALLGFLGGPPC